MGKSFGKIQHLFMIKKNSQQIWYKRIITQNNIIMYIYDKANVNIRLNSEKLKVFHISKKARMPFLTIFFFFNRVLEILNFPNGTNGKESACNAGNLDSISRSGRYPGEGNGYSLQYSCL